MGFEVPFLQSKNVQLKSKESLIFNASKFMLSPLLMTNRSKTNLVEKTLFRVTLIYRRKNMVRTVRDKAVKLQNKLQSDWRLFA